MLRRKQPELLGGKDWFNSCIYSRLLQRLFLQIKLKGRYHIPGPLPKQHMRLLVFQWLQPRRSCLRFLNYTQWSSMFLINSQGNFGTVLRDGLTHKLQVFDIYLILFLLKHLLLLILHKYTSFIWVLIKTIVSIIWNMQTFYFELFSRNRTNYRFNPFLTHALHIWMLWIWIGKSLLKYYLIKYVFIGRLVQVYSSV